MSNWQCRTCLHKINPIDSIVCIEYVFFVKSLKNIWSHLCYILFIINELTVLFLNTKENCLVCKYLCSYFRNKEWKVEFFIRVWIEEIDVRRDVMIKLHISSHLMQFIISFRSRLLSGFCSNYLVNSNFTLSSPCIIIPFIDKSLKHNTKFPYFYIYVSIIYTYLWYYIIILRKFLTFQFRNMP